MEPDALPRIELESMPQQLLVRDSTDDWTGVTDAAGRRRLQNRLNQRAYRQYISMAPCNIVSSANCPGLRSVSGKRKSSTTAKPSRKGPSPAAATSTPKGVEVSLWTTDAKTKTEDEDEECISLSAPVSTSKGQFSLCQHVPGGTIKRLQQMEQFARQAYLSYTSGTLSLGHLPTLLRLNVFHALSLNAATLGLDTAWLYYDAVSPWGRPGPLTAKELEIAAWPRPETLQPTALQRQVVHHPWLDLFPLPRMRDNFLRAIENPDVCDEDLLCMDLVEFANGGESDSASLIVWGDPWDPRGWEASVGFLRKWGWLLEGCPEILEGTNRWREKRGEKKLVFRT